MTAPSDNSSTKSWGVPPPRVTYPVSPTVTWGTLSSSSSSNSSLQAAIDHKTQPFWGSPAIVGSTQGWVSSASPPHYHSPSSLAYSPSASTSTYGGSSSLSVSTSGPAGGWTQLNPLLDSRSPHCLHFDLGLPIQYIHNMNESAVQPPVAFMQVLIVLNPFKWPVNIQVHGPVSVYQVVQQLHEFLQGYQHSQDMQKSKIVSSSLSSFAYHGHPQPQSDNYRDQNQRPSEFYSGTKRIDLLGRYRIFRGLSLSSSEHGTSWVVHLSDR